MDVDARIPNAPNSWHNNRLHFFKYMTANTAKIVLANRTLRWSTASVLNDPFDMQFDMSVSIDPDQLRTAALSKMWQLYASGQPISARNPAGVVMELLRRSLPKLTRDEFDREFGPSVTKGYDRLRARLPETHAEAAPHLAQIKILSLTTAPHNNLMWTHYADGHRGVVMRFKSIPALDSPYGMAKPMNYVTDVPPLFSQEELVDISAGIATIDVRSIVDRIIYTKSADYKYEQEWRISSGAGRDKHALFEDILFGRDELDGVILGMRISTSEEREIRGLAKSYPNTAIMRATRTRSSLDVSVEVA